MKRIIDYWAVILQSAFTFLLIALICETSWPIAYVYVDSVPTSAAVYDGEGFYWTTPAQIPVSHNGLRVTVSHRGRVPVDTILTPAMASAPVIVSLQYRFPVTVISDPPSASVFIDGSYSGTTPITLNVDQAGTHQIELTTEQLISFRDTFTLLVNSPCTLSYYLPSIWNEDMISIPEDDGDRYLISRHEVTNREFCQYLRWLEPSPVRDTTIRWGRTRILEELFPVDYPIHFNIGPGGMWTVQEGYQDHPVTGMTLAAARGYCQWLTMNEASGMTYRLPHVEEWQKAALAGGGGPWPWGSSRPDGRLLNLSDTNEGMLRRHPSLDDGYARTAPVCSYPCNGWGLWDMAGNVWEYCTPRESAGPAVALGGSWFSSMDDCKCEAMMSPDTSLGYPFLGFRVVAVPSDISAE